MCVFVCKKCPPGAMNSGRDKKKGSVSVLRSGVVQGRVESDNQPPRSPAKGSDNFVELKKDAPDPCPGLTRSMCDGSEISFTPIPCEHHANDAVSRHATQRAFWGGKWEGEQRNCVINVRK